MVVFVLLSQKVYHFSSFDSTGVVLRFLFQKNHSMAEAGDHLIHLLCLELKAACTLVLCSLPPALPLGTA